MSWTGGIVPQVRSGVSLEQITNVHDQVEKRLAELIPAENSHPERLHRAMRYSLLAPGKRIRPILTVLTVICLGGREETAIDPACAIEMVHTASLILDDLPFMDDARLRRGKPVNHRVFGENTAMLAAVALLNHAFGVLAKAEGLTDSLRRELIALLSSAIGSDGAIAGQLSDLHADRKQLSLESLERIHSQKTGALFVASAKTGARLADVSGVRLEAVQKFARDFGLAFQILDDLKDRLKTETAAGKDVDKDAGKTTFVTLMGYQGANERVAQLIRSASSALEPLGGGGCSLAQLVHFLPDDLSPL